MSSIAMQMAYAQLHQLRLAMSLYAVFITGVKHDIALLDRVNAVLGDSLTVLDVSVNVNRAALVTACQHPEGCIIGRLQCRHSS
jgi:hypothetical protein